MTYQTQVLLVSIAGAKDNWNFEPSPLAFALKSETKILKQSA